MIRFFIKRPIAVSMVFLAFLLLGVLASMKLPVGLIPDTDIPRITVFVHAPNYYARDLESTIMAPLRNYLLQVNKIRDLKTDARNGFGSLNLEFERGSNIKLALMEVNEQVDKAMSILPNDISRPVVLKASDSDIPVLYLDILLSEEYQLQETNTNDATEETLFLELSNFVDEVLRRRLEQLPEVAMADLGGRALPEIIISPDMNKIKALNMPLEKIEDAVSIFNNRPETILINEMQLQYRVRMANTLLNAEDIGNLYVKHGDRLWQLSDLCSIEMRVQPPRGKILSGKRRAMSMAVIKQADARMKDFKQALDDALQGFEKKYPYLEFVIYRDQTDILDHALLSLQQTLLVGAGLAFVVMLMFLRDTRAPWLIIISVPSAALVSMLFFFLANISINVISVSGLILCIGLMIDNSIIVIDNISRHIELGKHSFDACADGTNEVIKPLLCSVLTSCSVFVPLVFNRGLTGAVFYDQALAVSIGLTVSFMMAICIIPVYYHLFFHRAKFVEKKRVMVPRIMHYKRLYKAVFSLSMRNQKAVWLLAALFIAALLFFLAFIKKETMPDMQRNDMHLHIDWNEHIHVSENARRIRQMLEILPENNTFSNSQVGGQQFLLAGNHPKNQQQAIVYFHAESNASLKKLQKELQAFFQKYYPGAIHFFEEEIGLFDYVFGSSEPPLELRLLPLREQSPHDASLLEKTLKKLQENDAVHSIHSASWQKNLLVDVDMLALAMYDIDYQVLIQTIRNHTGEKQLIVLADGHTPLPVKLSGSQKNLHEIIARERVLSRNGTTIPLRYLLKVQSGKELQSIVAGMEGEYYPVELSVSAGQLKDVTNAVRLSLEGNENYRPEFHGRLFSRQVLLRQLVFTAGIAIILLFLILAAQFESLKLPFIVLLEVPIATGGALLLLCLLGVSLNIMSMIGIVVMAGIIINDSILKIDTINRLRNNGMPLMKALITAGHIRLKAILMTSTTTICALLPFLITGGLGSELQQPLAVAVIGGLGLGTLVSLFFIPVSYHYMYKNT